MKNLIKNIALLILFFVSTKTIAQYTINNNYLKTPELVIAHVDSCAKFWLPTYDEINGGFYENVSRDGTVSGTSKTMLGQSRTAYGMTKAFMLTGDTTYLDYARGALDFMYEHAWDKNNLGWFNEMNEDGSLRNGGHNDDKWSFMQHYALLGIATMVEATDTEIDWQYLISGRKAVDSLLWDSRPDYLGYYNEANVEWSNPNGKGFTPTADAVTTHGLSMFLINPSEENKTRLITLANNMSDYLVGNMDKFKYGFPESYDNEWNPNLNDTYVFTGHLLKAAWCMTRAYLIEKDEELLNSSTIILDHVLEFGYDHTYGGCYANYDGSSGVRYNNSKDWWQLEQAFTSAIMNYYISKDDRYLEMADETINFYMSHFVDKQYGEVYASTSESGNVTNYEKASYWKAGYHSIELGYYIYLYMNLYIHENPIKLYYNFKPVDRYREIKLTPLAIEDEKLKINSVKLNNSDYDNFISDSRTLNIPANEGGLFEVTFEATRSTKVANTEIPKFFKLHQNYPNPFNPNTVIKFDIINAGNIELIVYDMLGKKVKKLFGKYSNPGSYSINWNGTNSNNEKVATGMYVFKLKHENNFSVIKSILIK